ncbi:hypothetical protein TM1040_1656 [Ruegeria sp. TM1040]|uniref:hypothetical protein n=1 Tax=Ruegeria sp. (strain TM1040) TaxID=292414 RepID=UPI0000553A91|nr:hypothetical protein [Ruegeria sp. TM1040]ABF64389.1 hypothetical protein TM1040_1656 [Ruegeria sp. TM1040]
MSFRMIEPETIDDAAFVSSTVPETDAPVWDASTDYPFSDPDNPEEVIVEVGQHAIYRAVAPSGPSHGGAVDPATDTGNTKWVKIRSTNRWRVFDEYIGDPSVQANSAQWVITAPKVIDSVSLFGLYALSVTVLVRDSGGAEVYNQTYSLQDESGVVDLYTYLTSPIILSDRLVITDIPPYAGAKVTVTAEASGEDVEVGQIVIGRKEEIGVTIDEIPLSIQDFSRKERDPDFGRVSLLEKDFADEMPVAFVFPTSRASYLKSRLASRRAKLTVYSSDGPYKANEFSVYGFYQSFQVVPRIGSESEGILELESIT